MNDINPNLDKIIETEVEQQYSISFFEPFLINYIADFKPAFVSTIPESEYEDYIRRKNDEALLEFCRQIKLDNPVNEATKSALHTLLSDFRK